ncbi:iron-sulfur cluster-binding domain-containing protein [Paraflavitalea sp. CAU 1676]|uniref:flavin reductase family protein n=1 Tax=Paraflavitalea sp. CAU 1676 TaxID=3032598 RepID=UPI0023DC1547|nr:iron-sulfur cluster-binding domain-containing protein [Paraflavitalea sp. CAU 1676]MDF2191647.1 iron-sulfur cluster-binding domain-containing protein [Paraflavitalea sp. CAU 1676]
MNNAYTWRAAAVIRETHDTVTVVFDTGGAFFTYHPGQYISLTLLIDGEPVTRAYSLSSSPNSAQPPAITVKKITGGIMSTHIVEQAHSIRHWRVEGPFGSFTPPPGKHFVLMAGGSGITPLYSIANHLLRQSPAINITLLYSCRSQADIIFARQLEQWQHLYPGRTQTFIALSAGQDTDHPHLPGRMNKLLVKKLLRKAEALPTPATHYFLCGPDGLMEQYEAALAAIEVPATNIFRERFNPETIATAQLPQQVHEVMLHYYERSNLLEVQPGNTILTTALGEGVPIPYSCKTGTCGKCAGKLVAGHITMPANYALGAEQLQEGMILLCQSYPLNDDVTIEIG